MSKLNVLAIDIGHNVNYDTGAVGLRKEDELNRLVGESLISKCREIGINVVNCTPSGASSLSDSLNKRCNVANYSNADLFISIHHNAGGGNGAEVLVYKEGLVAKIGREVLNNICKSGLTDRGIKIRKDLAVLRNTSMPALLIECAFIDSPKDMNNYNVENIANAIFRGICSYFSINNNSNSAIYHTVVKGDTLWSISKKYGVTIGQIQSFNQISNINFIKIGQRIRIK
ncbi:MAG: N-acetylmuramoyl-L-alanine amidase [Candidatus Onthovivens sp.]|nr:N-acetylmuramoyl-L-alanine amidase [Candidatus Onthovivens sp.]